MTAQKRPLIGVSGSRNVTERHHFVRENYMQSVVAAGGLPMMLPHTRDEALALQMLDELDGLLLTGGGDVEPARYGEEKLPVCDEPDAQRDDFELLIGRLALERGMPVFGICRGIQLLTVLMGGTLYQDIETQLGIERIRHSQNPPYNEPAHAVRFVSGGLLERIAGAQEVRTNSMHHQCVKDAGPRLIVEGWSEDGVVEAVRAAHTDDVFAVQYHPEYMAAETEHAARLFRYHVECARAYAARKA